MKTFLAILFASVGLLSTIPELTAFCIVLIILTLSINTKKSKS